MLIAGTLIKARPFIKTPPNAPVGPRSARLAVRMLTLRQRTIHSQFEKHGLLLISLHQRAASFVVVGIGGYCAFCVLNVLVDAAKIVRVLSLHRRRQLGRAEE